MFVCSWIRILMRKCLFVQINQKKWTTDIKKKNSSFFYLFEKQIPIELLGQESDVEIDYLLSITSKASTTIILHPIRLRIRRRFFLKKLIWKKCHRISHSHTFESASSHNTLISLMHAAVLEIWMGDIFQHINVC